MSRFKSSNLFKGLVFAAVIATTAQAEEFDLSNASMADQMSYFRAVDADFNFLCSARQWQQQQAAK